MKKIIKIITDKELVLEEQWSAYIYSTIFNFLNERKLYDDNLTEYIIATKDVAYLALKIRESLKQLLDSFYLEPATNEIQKNSTRYEKIYLNDKIYTVNYRMSVGGRMAYAIYCILNLMNTAEEKDINLILKCV